ncbi:MAG: hypothetical protein MUE99_12155 [Chitinophagaceae bacterium]|nr:hypothetical protein [Chitinophagaceae bacterium]
MGCFFLLSNLVAVTLSTIALYASFILGVMVWFVGPVAKVVGWIAEKTIMAMNEFVAWVYDLPFSRIENIYITTAEAVFISVIISLFSAWILLKNKSAAVAAMACISIFIIQREYRWHKQGKQQLLIVYNVNRGSAMDIVRGHTASFLGDDDCMDSTGTCNSTLKQARMVYGINAVQRIQRDTAGFQVIKVGNKKLLVLDKEPDLRQSANLSVDWIYIDINLKAKPEWVLEKVMANTIIAGAKLPVYKLRQWHSAADSLHLRFHPVREKGAFLHDFNLQD